MSGKTEKKHALLGGSGAHRWLVCTPSARLEKQFADNAGDAAAEGTAAHALAEYKLAKALGLPAQRPQPSQWDSDEMEACTDDYVNLILEKVALAKQTCPDPLVCIEEQVDYSRYVPEGSGTADCLVVADGTLWVIDFKYGRGHRVPAEDNPQMKVYALGALAAYDGIYGIDTVSMTVCQPRCENTATWTTTKDALQAWAEDVLRPAAALAFAGEGAFCPGEHCLFCRASVTCRARADRQLALARLDFPMPPTLTDEEIMAVYPKLDGLKKWAENLREYVMAQAVGGKAWPGYRLVSGGTQRQYADEAKAAAALEQAGVANIYKKALRSLTDMEKRLGKARFYEILGELIVSKPKGPKLVPDSPTAEALDG